jgi:hypothetical protein
MCREVSAIVELYHLDHEVWIQKTLDKEENCCQDKRKADCSP